MSKKISQLTKVIYILNTKADENEYNMQCMEEAYEADIDAVLKNAYEKITDLKKRLEEKGDDGKGAMQLIEALKKKHEAEKEESMRQFMLLKTQATSNEQVLRNASREKIEQLRMDIDEMKSQFMIKMQAFGRLAKGMEENYAHNMDMLKEKHSEEVKEWSARYDKLASEKDELEKELRQRLTNALKESNQESTLQWEEKFMKYKDEQMAWHNNEMLRAQEGHDKSVGMLNKDWAAKLSALSSEMEQVKRENAQLSTTVGEHKALLKRKDEEIESLRAIRDRLQAQMGSSTSELQKTIEKLQTDVRQMQGTVTQTTASLKAREQELETATRQSAEMARMLQEKEAKVRDLTQQLELTKSSGQKVKTELQGRIDALAAEVDKLQKDIVESEGDLKAVVKQREDKIQELTDQLIETQKKNNGTMEAVGHLKGRENELSERIKALEQAEADLKKKVAELSTALEKNKASKAALKQQIEEHQNNEKNLRLAVQVRDVTCWDGMGWMLWMHV